MQVLEGGGLTYTAGQKSNAEALAMSGAYKVRAPDLRLRRVPAPLASRLSLLALVVVLEGLTVKEATPQVARACTDFVGEELVEGDSRRALQPLLSLSPLDRTTLGHQARTELG